MDILYIFAGVVLFLLLWDFLAPIKNPHHAAISTLVLAFSVFLGYAIYFFLESITNGTAFVSVYVIELTLSIDNLFVFTVIFKHYDIQAQTQRRLLAIGILSAFVFRALFITAGVAFYNKVTWAPYILGIVLVWTAYHLLKKKEKKNYDSFFIDRWTWLKKLPYRNVILAFLAIEGVDILFALDSIPASLAISSDTRILIIANLLAVVGMRAMYYFLSKMLSRMENLNTALGIILGFVGVKIFISPFFKIPTALSLAIILSILGCGLFWRQIKARLSS